MIASTADLIAAVTGALIGTSIGALWLVQIIGADRHQDHNPTPEETPR